MKYNSSVLVCQENFRQRISGEVMIKMVLLCNQTWYKDRHLAWVRLLSQVFLTWLKIIKVWWI